MAKIRDRISINSSGSYERVFGNKKLGNLISKVHGTSIADGTELEKLIRDHISPISNLDEFLEKEIMEDGIYLASKEQIKKSQTFDSHHTEPDFLIFKRRNRQQICYVIELKDGHVFDTKKAKAERDSLHGFTERNGQHISYKFQIYVCCFNVETKEQAYDGLKRKILKDEILTGREFCNLFEIDYNHIIESRKKDQEENLHYFLNELIKIKEIDVFLQKQYKTLI